MSYNFGNIVRDYDICVKVNWWEKIELSELVLASFNASLKIALRNYLKFTVYLLVELKIFAML